jgi:hypothetical protein
MIIIGLTALTILAVIAERHFDLREVRRFTSPDGRHALVVYRRPLVFAPPGQASDAPGVIILETAAGEELRRQNVEMIQLVSQPEWTPDRVEMKLLLDWPLSE